MRLLRLAIKLPFFLTAEAVLWIVAIIGSHIFFLHRDPELLLQHERLVDWLWVTNALPGTGWREAG